MKIKAQVAMVLNLDKCIGCHTCSVTCKNTWTNRPGAEYMWFNNVETKPGVGYPKRWEDQGQYKGGWVLNKKGKLELKSGNRWSKIALGKIFYNPDMPLIQDYYEPWTYNYEHLTNAKQGQHSPVATAHSLISGDRLNLKWGPNWEDDLAGGHITGPEDPNIQKIEEDIKFQFDETFMMYLPRLCEHCLNPSCVASCPSGAMYKRDEDGIVLVDQEACRGWRYCMTGCPYKKVYFNWKTNKAEKCTFCFPRIEAGMPTVCSETCTGRMRYLGVLLYDADRVQEAASAKDEKDLYEKQLDLFLDPFDEEVIAQAEKDGINQEWITAAQNSPVYKLAIEYKMAFPLHPEFRTMPMVWYCPPLSPIMSYFEGENAGQNPDMIFPAIEEMRLPIQYLANLLTAGDTEPVKEGLQKMAMMRSYMRSQITKQPFTAMYQNIDEQRGISAFTLQNVAPQIERQEKMYQQKMLHRSIQAQENERKRISRELHDSVIQDMLNIDVELRLLKYKHRDKVLAETSQRIEGLLSQLIDDIRNMSVELRPSSLDDLGIEAAFKSYFKQFEENYGMHIKYDSNIKGMRFDSEIETVVYRVVQEGLFNALKYAEVNEIEVSTHSDGKQLVAEVVDRGKGFSLNNHPKGSGLGLYGMRERAELVNGHINIETHINRGTIITLDIPI